MSMKVSDILLVHAKCLVNGEVVLLLVLLVMEYLHDLSFPVVSSMSTKGPIPFI